jgi:putative transposase
MTAWLQRQGHAVNRKRVVRLMRQMGIEAGYAKPKLSRPGEGHKIYPYILKEMKIERKNQVGCTDITYVPMRQGFLYLVAVMDWFSRFVLSWRLSLTMELEFCLEALERALRWGSEADFYTES